MVKKLVILSIGLLFLAGCETKFNINGDYEEVPVVHFLLDQGETYHFLKLNKTFLKDGNAKEYAQDPANSYFDNVVATVTEVKNGSEVKKWILQDTIIHNKKKGAFYYPDQKLYYFKEANLDADALYKLDININDGEHEVTGQTSLIQGVSITYPTQNMAFQLATNDVSQDGYKYATIRFSPSDDAALYKAQLRFDYEEYTATDSTEKSLYWNVGEIKQTDIGSSLGALSGSGQAFFEFLGNSIEHNSDVVKRNVRGVAIILTAATPEVYTYILSSQPTSSSFAQNKTTFTNLDGGIGIFSARFTTTQYKVAFTPPFIRALDVNSTQELCLGQYTYDKKFCSDIVADNSYPFYCGN